MNIVQHVIFYQFYAFVFAILIYVINDDGGKNV